MMVGRLVLSLVSTIHYIPSPAPPWRSLSVLSAPVLQIPTVRDHAAFRGTDSLRRFGDDVPYTRVALLGSSASLWGTICCGLESPLNWLELWWLGSSK